MQPPPPVDPLDRASTGVFPKVGLKLSTTAIPWPVVGAYQLRAYADGNIWNVITIVSGAETIRTGFHKVLVTLKDQSPEALKKLQRSIKTFPGYFYNPRTGGHPFFALGSGVVAYTTTAHKNRVDLVIMKDGKVVFTYEGPTALGNLGLHGITVAHVGMSIHGTVMEVNGDAYLHSFFIDLQADGTVKVYHSRVVISKKSPGGMFRNNAFRILSAAGSMVLVSDVNDVTSDGNKSWSIIYRVLRIPSAEELSPQQLQEQQQLLKPVTYTLDSVVMYAFEPRNTQSGRQPYAQHQGDGAVDAEGNVVFTLFTSTEPKGTYVFHVSAKSFQVRMVAGFYGMRVENLIGGPGGQLLAIVFEEEGIKLRELIPVSAPDDYTHFYQGDQIGTDAARLQEMRDRESASPDVSKSQY